MPSDAFDSPGLPGTGHPATGAGAQPASQHSRRAGNAAASKPATICVVGSLNLDYIAVLDRLPGLGETLMAKSFTTAYGGKGANQAVAAARAGGAVAAPVVDTVSAAGYQPAADGQAGAGADGEALGTTDYRAAAGYLAGASEAGAGVRVSMIGAVGKDDAGKAMLANLREAAIDTAGVMVADGPSGVALIHVDTAGDNTIVVYPGANAALTVAWVREYAGIIERSNCLMLQLESPMEAVLAAAQIARAARVPVLLNPAPARPLPDELLACCSVVTPNRTELVLLAQGTGATGGAAGPSAGATGGAAGPSAGAKEPGEQVSDDDVRNAAEALLARGVGAVAVTLGAAGCRFMDGTRDFEVPSYKIDAVDTTAAGDSFNGALATFLADAHAGATAANRNDGDTGCEATRYNAAITPAALRFCNAAGAIAATKLGAQPSIPYRSDILELAVDPGKPETSGTGLSQMRMPV